MPKLQDMCSRAELGLLLVQWLGFCCAPILCNCTRGLLHEACAEAADEARKMALRDVLGQRRVLSLGPTGSCISNAVLFQRTCQELIDCIMEAWGQLANGAIFYPGLTESSEATCVWRDHPSAFCPLLNAMLVRAGVRQKGEWESWRHLMGPARPLPKTFLDAWRTLNPETPAVARISSLLEHGTYEVRIYPYDAVHDRQPILVLTWAIFGVSGVFSVEDTWAAKPGDL